MTVQELAQGVNTFWEFNVGHLIDTGLLFVAALGYTLSRKSDIKKAQEAREKMITEQMKMHTENRERLEVLARFSSNQEKINQMRDKQVSLLREQTAALQQIALGQDRRLQLIENRTLGS